MTAKTEKIWSVLDSVYRGLCKWDLRSASYDNPIAALIFLFFLKFVSDNKATLGLDYPEKYEFDYLALLYGQKINHREIVEHVSVVEEQLGIKGGVLASFTNDLELLRLDEDLVPLLQAIKELNLKLNNEQDYTVHEAVTGFIMMQARKELRFAGESVTEVNLAKLMSNVADVKEGMAIYDFASGYAVSLSDAVKGKKAIVYAQDIKKVCAAVSAMMLVFSLNKNFTVICGDTLNHPSTIYEGIPKKFDRVIAEPPFGMVAARMQVTPEIEEAFEFGLGNTNRTDLIFAQHLLASLKPDGKGVLLMPLGALFRSGKEAKLRRAIVEKNYIEAIIELPVGVIQSTGIKAAIVVFNKAKANSGIYVLDLSKDAVKGYIERSGRAGVRITDYGLKAISEIVAERKIVDGLSRIVSVDEVLENGVNLCAGAYLGMPSNDKIEVQDIEELKKRGTALFNRLVNLDKRFNEIIERI